MVIVLLLSLFLNAGLILLCLWGFKRYAPHPINYAQRILGKSWWVIPLRGAGQTRYRLYTHEGTQVNNIVKGSVQLAKDRCGLNTATLKVFVNYSEHERDMLEKIEEAKHA